ncbi:MAG: acetolactate synthase large subunit [Candidatus Brocadiales bacterium]
MKASDLMVRCLENEGVEYVFGVPGEEVVDLLNSMRSSSVRFITTRHEQGAAFMASVVGRLTGRAGVCMATLGPGATNLTTGLADANLDHAPVVAITGQADLRRAYKESKQILDVVAHFKPITKWNTQVERAVIIPELVRKAFKVAQSEKPGACHLELPTDVAEQEVEGAPLPLTEVSCPSPDEGSLKEAARLVNEARYPIILAGNGVIRGDASTALREFVEHTLIPVAHTFGAMGCVSADSDLCLLSVGLQQHDHVNCGFDRSDLVIGIGYDFAEYESEMWNPKGDKKIVNIDVLSSEVDFHYSPTVEVLGNIRDSLRLLRRMVDRKKIHAKTDTLRKHIIQEIKEYAHDESCPLKPQRVLNDVRKALGRGGILVSDVGAHKIWVARSYMAYEPKSVLISFGFAAMGFGIPAAIAAKLVHPEKKVIAVCGDGGFMMTSMELETASRVGTPFITLIFRDDTYGLIKWKQLSKFGVDFGVDFKNPDFVQYAEAFGMDGYRVKRPSELLPILKKALSEDRPTIVDVPIDFNENLRLSEKLGQLICPA